MQVPVANSDGSWEMEQWPILLPHKTASWLEVAQTQSKNIRKTITINHLSLETFFNVDVEL